MREGADLEDHGGQFEMRHRYVVKDDCILLV